MLSLTDPPTKINASLQYLIKIAARYRNQLVSLLRIPLLGEMLIENSPEDIMTRLPKEKCLMSTGNNSSTTE